MRIRKNLIIIIIASALFGVLCGFYFKTLNDADVSLRILKLRPYTPKWQVELIVRRLEKKTGIFSLTNSLTIYRSNLKVTYDFNSKAMTIGFLASFILMIIVKQRVSRNAVTNFLNGLERNSKK